MEERVTEGIRGYAPTPAPRPPRRSGASPQAEPQSESGSRMGARSGRGRGRGRTRRLTDSGRRDRHRGPGSPRYRPSSRATRSVSRVGAQPGGGSGGHVGLAAGGAARRGCGRPVRRCGSASRHSTIRPWHSAVQAPSAHVVGGLDRRDVVAGPFGREAARFHKAVA